MLKQIANYTNNQCTDAKCYISTINYEVIS